MFKALVLFTLLSLYVYESIILLHQSHDLIIWRFFLSTQTLFSLSCMHLLASYSVLEVSYPSYITSYQQIKSLRSSINAYFVMKCVLSSYFWLCWCSLCNICVDFAVPLWNAVLYVTVYMLFEQNVNISEWAKILMEDGWIKHVYISAETRLMSVVWFK